MLGWMMQFLWLSSLGAAVFWQRQISKAHFRIILIRPADYDLFGIFRQGIYYDRVIPMGSASSCQTFEMISAAVELVAKTHLSAAHLVYILDDYLTTEPTYHQWCIDLVHFLSLCVCYMCVNLHVCYTIVHIAKIIPTSFLSCLL